MLTACPINPLQPQVIKPVSVTAVTVNNTNSWVDTNPSFKNNEYYILQLKNKDLVLGKYLKDINKFVFTDLSQTEFTINVDEVLKTKYIMTSDL